MELINTEKSIEGILSEIRAQRNNGYTITYFITGPCTINRIRSRTIVLNINKAEEKVFQPGVMIRSYKKGGFWATNNTHRLHKLSEIRRMLDWAICPVFKNFRDDYCLDCSKLYKRRCSILDI